MKKFLAIALLATLASCGSEDKKAPEEPQKAAPLSQSKNSEQFNLQFGNLLTNYFHLKDALVLTNDSLATKAAGLLKASADSVQLKELSADKSIVEMAGGYLSGISSEAAGLQGEKDIEGKRKSFQLISDNMYDLVRTVRYDRQVIYHQYCPMYNNDQGGYWLSPDSDIKNPYFGKKMLTCGEVKDSIDLRGK